MAHGYGGYLALPQRCPRRMELLGRTAEMKAKVHRPAALAAALALSSLLPVPRAQRQPHHSRCQRQIKGNCSGQRLSAAVP